MEPRVMSSCAEHVSPVFQELADEVEDSDSSSDIESFCVVCEKNGITRLLLTKIPFYKEVIVASFFCEHCGNRNNEVTNASPVQDQGIDIVLKVLNDEDLNRQVVKTDSSVVTIPDLDFEIPMGSQKGTLSTVEGILRRSTEGLLQDQILRRALDPTLADKLEAFVEKMNVLLIGKTPFTLRIRDPSGNSFVENPLAPADDPQLTLTKFQRTLDDRKALGLAPDDAEEEAAVEAAEKAADEAAKEAAKEAANDTQSSVPKDEVLSFPTNCPECQVEVETRMKMTNIPHFKEVVIMATTCEACGNKTNEVKVGGGVAPQGRRIRVNVKDPSDMTRDVLKSETCTLSIPELEFEALLSSNGGKFTTVEGLLESIKEQLLEGNPFLVGDSAKSETKSKMAAFAAKLDGFLRLETPFTLKLDDPAGNSFVQNFYAPDPDPEMEIEDYDRSPEDDAFLGIDQMKTEDY